MQSKLRHQYSNLRFFKRPGQQQSKSRWTNETENYLEMWSEKIIFKILGYLAKLEATNWADANGSNSLNSDYNSNLKR